MDGLSDVIESSGLLSLVSKIAPALATGLGSPVAGVLVSLIANAFHVESKSVLDLVKTIQSDPEAAIKIKNIEYEHIEELERIAAQNFSVQAMDIQDARRYGDRAFLMFMAVVVTIGFFGAMFLLYWQGININDTEKQLLSLLIGMLASKWQTIIDFFYGLSRTQGVIK